MEYTCKSFAGAGIEIQMSASFVLKCKSIFSKGKCAFFLKENLRSIKLNWVKLAFFVAQCKIGVFRNTVGKTRVFRITMGKTDVFRNTVGKTGVFRSTVGKTGVFRSTMGKTGVFRSTVGKIGVFS